MVEASFHLECHEEQALIELFLDGELGREEQRELEGHLDGCEDCQAFLESRAVLAAKLEEASSATLAPASLAARVTSALDGVDFSAPLPLEDEQLFATQGSAASPVVVPLRRRHWTRRLPVLASAAGLALFVWVAGGGFGGATNEGDNRLVNDTVSRHARALPLEIDTPDPARVRGWARGKVDFNPRLPRFQAGLRPVGARLSHVLDRPAVYLAYQEPDGGSAGLFVFAEGETLRFPSSHTKIRRVGNHQVILAHRRGYNVVLWRDRGIVYSLVSDLDELTLLRLVEVSDR